MRILAGALLCLVTTATLAQGASQRELILDGKTIHYAVLTHASDVQLPADSARIAPTSAINTARLLHRHLVAGDIEEAALLSNAPRRRYEVYLEFRESIGKDEFKRLFEQYFYPENRIVAEVQIGRHRLLIWDLRQQKHLAGQFFVEVEGKVLMDDAPSEARSRMRQILEAYRSGDVRP